MPGMRDYFWPKRKLYRPPRHLTAQYNRADVSREQQLIMMAGLARDPQQAQQVYLELREKHGSAIWDFVDLEIRRKRTSTFRQRFMMLMRKIFGEDEYERFPTSPHRNIVKPDYRISYDENEN